MRTLIATLVGLGAGIAFNPLLRLAGPVQSSEGSTELKANALRLVDSSGLTRILLGADGMQPEGWGGENESGTGIRLFDAKGTERASLDVGNKSTRLVMTSSEGQSSASIRCSEGGVMAIYDYKDGPNVLFHVDRERMMCRVRRNDMWVEYEMGSIGGSVPTANAEPQPLIILRSQTDTANEWAIVPSANQELIVSKRRRTK
jgi:hypothetical protein